MATKKRRAQKNSPRITDREEGYVVTSLRLEAAENKLLRDASAELGMSFNWWSVQTLTAEAKKILKNKPKDKN